MKKKNVYFLIKLSILNIKLMNKSIILSNLVKIILRIQTFSINIDLKSNSYIINYLSILKLILVLK